MGCAAAATGGGGVRREVSQEDAQGSIVNALEGFFAIRSGRCEFQRDGHGFIAGPKRVAELGGLRDVDGVGFVEDEFEIEVAFVKEPF